MQKLVYHAGLRDYKCGKMQRNMQGYRYLIGRVLNRVAKGRPSQHRAENSMTKKLSDFNLDLKAKTYCKKEYKNAVVTFNIRISEKRKRYLPSGKWRSQ